MYGYGIMLELYNQDKDKGIKGIEYPTGEITFDINLKLERSSFNNKQLEDITSKCNPVLWNYSLNGSTKGLVDGREIYTNGNLYQRLIDSMPLGTIVKDRTYHTKNSGNISMLQNGSNIKVTISNYKLDGIFPIYNYKDYTNRIKTPSYGENEGIFHVTHFQIFVPENEESTMADRNYYLTVTDENLKAESISGAQVNKQEKENDDKVTIQHIIYSAEKYSHSMLLVSEQEKNQPLGSSFSSGDSQVAIGQTFEMRARSKLASTNSFDINSMCKFIKFDGSAVEPIKYQDGSVYKKHYFNGSMEFKVWYVTKKDGTNWIDQKEMNNANIENMNIYENIEDIPNGDTCVGMFFESIGGNLAVSSGTSNAIGIRFKVKETAKIGSTYGFTQRTKYWKDELNRNIYTITNKDVVYPDLTWDSKNLQYVKTEYDENGTMIAGTHRGGTVYGNTILVLGAELKVTRNVDEKLEDGKQKSVYDIGKNEYDVIYKVSPSITNNFSNNKVTGINLKITDTLPKGIKYISGSCNYEEPEITNNEDETTVLTWYKYNCSIGEDIEPITYKAHISEETDNGTQFETKTVVQEVIAENEVSKIGNSRIELRTAKNTIQVVNLQSYSFYKTTDTPVIEANGIGHYKITTINKTDSKIADFQLLDILPYNGDNRGTSFNGTYIVEKIQIKQVNSENKIIDNSNLNLYITNDSSVRENVTAKDENLGTGSIWEKAYSEKINKMITGYAITGELGEKVKLEVDIYLKTDGNKSKDVYNNSATAQTNSLTEEMKTPAVQISVISRKLEGKVWFDKNKNGLIDNEEEYLSGIRVSLVKADGTESFDVDGQVIGEQITNENGYYSFENMQKGKYKVLIKLDNDKYEITKKDVGSNEEINSKFNLDYLTDIINNFDSNDVPSITVKNINAGITYKDTSVLVHHYIEGTTTKLSDDVTINGMIDDEYITNVANDIPANYEVALIPDNAKGLMTKQQIVVTYYYKLKTPIIENLNISKDTTIEKITDIEERVPYEMNYKAMIDQYIGNAQLTIIDELPYKINVAKSNLQEGTYDSINRTITWKENITNINTFANGKKEIVITKNIELVYDDINVNDNKVTNKVKAILELETPNTQDTVETTKSIDTEYLVNITVHKNWIDNNDSYGKRPENIILQIKNKQTQEIVQSYKLPKSELSHIFTGLAKYNQSGDKVEYIVEEKEEKEGDLFYYSTQIGQIQDVEQDNKEITITNTIAKIPSKVIVEYIDKSTNEKLDNDIVIDGYVNDEYSTDKKNIEYYNFVESTNNTKGNMSEKTTVVKYYYEKQIFNLKIDKWVDSIKINGNTKKAQTIYTKNEIYKIDISKKDINSTDLKIIYKIRISNNGEIEGDIKSISEIIPSGYSFYQEDNEIKWTQENGMLITKFLPGETIKPGKYKEISIVYRWNNTLDNFGIKQNTATILESDNPAGFMDANKEDDISNSKILFSATTGIELKNDIIIIAGALIILIGSIGGVVFNKIKGKNRE